MASYKVGHIEHGYKIVLAMELLDACVRIDEKMLIFRFDFCRGLAKFSRNVSIYSQNLTALDLIENYLSRRPLRTSTETTSWMKNINYFSEVYSSVRLYGFKWALNEML